MSYARQMLDTYPPSLAYRRRGTGHSNRCPQRLRPGLYLRASCPERRLAERLRNRVAERLSLAHVL